jgi:hypothetical protein
VMLEGGAHAVGSPHQFDVRIECSDFFGAAFVMGSHVRPRILSLKLISLLFKIQRFDIELFNIKPI